jgi:hypothetical protein
MRLPPSSSFRPESAMRPLPAPPAPCWCHLLALVALGGCLAAGRYAPGLHPPGELVRAAVRDDIRATLRSAALLLAPALLVLLAMATARSPHRWRR